MTRPTRAKATERQVAAAKAAWAQWKEEFGSPYPTFDDLDEAVQDKWVRIANATTTKYTNFRAR